MSKRDLFRLVIKLAGMYFLFVTILPILPSYISLFVMNGANAQSILAYAVGSLILIGLFVFDGFRT